MKTTITLFTLLASLTTAPLAHASVIGPIQDEQVPAGMGYAVSQPPVEDSHMFEGKKVAIFASHGVEEEEILFPLNYLKARGASVDIVVPSWTPQGIVISRFLKPTLWITADQTFKSAFGKRYDLIVLTGGAWNAQVVKSDIEALQLITYHYRSGRPLAAICAGTEILISATLVSGQAVTGPFYSRSNLNNAGGHFTDQPAVFSGNLLTSRDPNDLVQFSEGLKQLLMLPSR